MPHPQPLDSLINNYTVNYLQWVSVANLHIQLKMRPYQLIDARIKGKVCEGIIGEDPQAICMESPGILKCQLKGRTRPRVIRLCWEELKMEGLFHRPSTTASWKWGHFRRKSASAHVGAVNLWETLLVDIVFSNSFIATRTLYILSCEIEPGPSNDIFT